MESTKIIICEDSEALSSLVKFKLFRSGYTNCDIAPDGKIAMEMIRDNLYDLIISDINMPFATGLEITTYIREELKRSTPITILTSDRVEGTVLDAFNLGINDFLTKPFSPQELAVRVKKLLGHK